MRWLPELAHVFIKSCNYVDDLSPIAEASNGRRWIGVGFSSALRSDLILAQLAACLTLIFSITSGDCR
jgi:hypothetical protein